MDQKALLMTLKLIYAYIPDPDVEDLVSGGMLKVLNFKGQILKAQKEIWGWECFIKFNVFIGGSMVVHTTN